jgi:hypothetical protein
MTTAFEISTYCVTLKRGPQNGNTELVLHISFSATLNANCSQLQNVIDSGKFPVLLRGTTVVF